MPFATCELVFQHNIYVYESSYMALFRVRRVLATQVLLVPTLSILQLHSSIKLALLRLLTEGFIWENSNLLRDSHLIYVGVFI